jgi:hypothetical protein
LNGLITNIRNVLVVLFGWVRADIFNLSCWIAADSKLGAELVGLSGVGSGAAFRFGTG